MVRGTERLQNDLNCVDGDVKPQQNKQIIVNNSVSSNYPPIRQI